MGTLGWGGEGYPLCLWIEMPIYRQNCRGGIWYLTPRGPSIRALCPGLGVGDPFAPVFHVKHSGFVHGLFRVCSGGAMFHVKHSCYVYVLFSICSRAWRSIVRRFSLCSIPRLRPSIVKLLLVTFTVCGNASLRSP